MRKTLTNPPTNAPTTSPTNGGLTFLPLAAAMLLGACEPRVDDAATMEPQAVSSDSDADAPDQPNDPEAPDRDAPTDPSQAPAGDVPDAQGGVFAMDATDAAMDPAGCRLEKEGQWSFELSLPDAGEQSWVGVERFDQYATQYQCTGTTGAFECVTEQGHDYGPGLDADVSLVVTYEGGWTSTKTIGGDFSLAFTCAGADCDDVAKQWTVEQFPCATDGKFEGVLQ